MLQGLLYHTDYWFLLYESECLLPVSTSFSTSKRLVFSCTFWLEKNLKCLNRISVWSACIWLLFSVGQYTWTPHNPRVENVICLWLHYLYNHWFITPCVFTQIICVVMSGYCLDHLIILHVSWRPQRPPGGSTEILLTFLLGPTYGWKSNKGIKK